MLGHIFYSLDTRPKEQHVRKIPRMSRLKFSNKTPDIVKLNPNTNLKMLTKLMHAVVKIQIMLSKNPNVFLTI